MRLLVSVRSRDEALAALSGGADIIDAKEPSAGALGQVSVATFADIVDAVAGHRPVTAAIGDVSDEAVIEGRALAFAHAGAAFVKVGLAGVDALAMASRLLLAARRGATAGGASLVAVAYADGDRGGLSPDDVVSAAAVSGARGVLLDTASKGDRGVLQLMPPTLLAKWIARVHAAGLFAAVGGQLAATGLQRVRECGADIAGVRGAACDGGRNGTVSLRKVQALAGALRARARDTSPTAGPLALPARSTDRR